METKKQFAVGIDIGSASTKVVVGGKNDEGKFVILGKGEVANQGGMRKGVISDLTKSLVVLDKAIHQAETSSKTHISSAVVNINGDHLIGLARQGVISVGASGHPINEADLRRVKEVACMENLPENRKILMTAERQYAVDGVANITDPLGMTGVKLAVDAYLVTALMPVINNIEQLFEQENDLLMSVNPVISGWSAAQIALTDQQCENGVLLIDFGAATMNLAVYENGVIIYTSVLPYGANNITNDIATILAIDWITAEQIKCKYAYAMRDLRVGGKNMINIEVGGEQIEIDLRMVDAIVEARVKELFELVNDKLREIGKFGKLPSGIVLVGGGAKLTGIATVAREIMRLNTRVYLPDCFGGIGEDLKDPKWTNVLGLMQLDFNVQAIRRPMKKKKKGKFLFWKK